MNAAKLDRWSRIAGFAALAPAFLLVGASALQSVGVADAGAWLNTLLQTSMGRVALSPVVSLGGLLFAALLNLVVLCRLWPSWDEDYIALTVSFRRQGTRLIQLGLSLALLTCLLAYAFLENFKIVVR